MGKWDSESGTQKLSSPFFAYFYSDFSVRALRKSFDKM